MANNSATGGYLLPLQASPPLEDAELEAVFQGYIAGVSGLPSNLVRTRWPAAGRGTARARPDLVPHGHPVTGRGRRSCRDTRSGRGGD